MENPIDMDDLGYPHVRKPPNGLAIDSFSKEFLNQKKTLDAPLGSSLVPRCAEDRQHQMFVQRLREVAYVQSKAR